jgi:hypothetical protein
MIIWYNNDNNDNNDNKDNNDNMIIWYNMI